LAVFLGPLRNYWESRSEREAGERQVQPSPTQCASCGGTPSWEQTFDGWGERWLGACACGRIETFFPDRRLSSSRQTR